MMKMLGSIVLFIWSKFKVTSNIAAEDLALRQQLAGMKRTNKRESPPDRWLCYDNKFISLLRTYRQTSFVSSLLMKTILTQKGADYAGETFVQTKGSNS
jgi:hypothetical protein